MRNAPSGAPAGRFLVVLRLAQPTRIVPRPPLAVFVVRVVVCGLQKGFIGRKNMMPRSDSVKLGAR